MFELFGKPKPLRGVLAIYDNPDTLIAAAARVREHGYRNADAYTPYPVHGLSEALGIKKSWIPYVTLIMGLTGAALGLLFEIWTSAVDWPINVGGKPFVSLPAFIPITFESGVLIGGTMTLAALLLACGLPNYNAPILDRSLTDDRFALFIPDSVAGWNEDRTMQFLSGTGATDVRVIRA